MAFTFGVLVFDIRIELDGYSLGLLKPIPIKALDPFWGTSNTDVTTWTFEIFSKFLAKFLMAF